MEKNIARQGGVPGIMNRWQLLGLMASTNTHSPATIPYAANAAAAYRHYRKATQHTMNLHAQHQSVALPEHSCLVVLSCAGVADGNQSVQAHHTTQVHVLIKCGPVHNLGCFRPLLRELEVLAVGSPEQVAAHEAARSAIPIDASQSVLVPGFVNAHTHLDLTHLGPRVHHPHDGFVAWVDQIREGRLNDAAAIRASVAKGIELSLQAGVVAIGDIAGAPGGVPSLEPWHELTTSCLQGVSFVEFFAMGKRWADQLDRLEQVIGAGIADGHQRADDLLHTRVMLGISPHAPNTVCLAGYARARALAKRHDMLLTTHLAETIEERTFLKQGTGPQQQLLERFGLWDQTVAATVGYGKTPVEHLAKELKQARYLLAHLNDCSDSDLAYLAQTDAMVVYCPRASAYFAAALAFGPHRYKDMITAGIPVALGTDSIVNLPAGTEDPAGAGMGTLDEARLLYRCDGTDAQLLMAMATVNGYLALGKDRNLGLLSPGAMPGGLGLVDVSMTEQTLSACERVMRSDARCQLLAVGTG